MSVHVEANLSCCSPGAIHLALWKRGFSLCWNLPIIVEWLPASPKDRPISASPEPHPGVFLYVDLGDGIQVSVLVRQALYRISHFRSSPPPPPGPLF